MSKVSTVRPATRGSAKGNIKARRSYDSPLRKAQSSKTRARILDAGSHLAHRLKNWDWTQLTARSVAQRARISERTVYRYFATERELQEAIMLRLEEEAGISYETLHTDNLLDATASMFASLPTFASSPALKRDPKALSGTKRRQQGLQQAIAKHTAEWSVKEQHMVAAVLDVQWLPATYERLSSDWGLNSTEVTQAASWAMNVLLQAIKAGNRPGLKIKRVHKSK